MKKQLLIMHLLATIILPTQLISQEIELTDSKIFHSTTGSSIVKFSTDQFGNIFITGNFTGSMVIGDKQLTSKGGDDFFIAKLNSAGQAEWALSGGGAGNDFIAGCDLDAGGNVLVAGHFSDSMQIGDKELIKTGGPNPFVAKADGAGNVLWAVRAGSNAGCTGVAVDPDGNGYIIGSFSNTAVIGADTMSAFLSTGAFAARFDQGGNILWSDGATCVTDIGWKSLGIDQSGDAIITGFVEFSADFDSFSVTAPHGWYDVITVKYQSNGKMSWAKTAGGSSFDQPAALRIDSNGGAVIVGAYGAPFIPGGINFDSYFLPQIGQTDIFVARYDSNGDVIWARNAGGVDFDNAWALALDSSNNIYWAGRYEGESYVSNLKIDPTNSNGIFLSRLFEDGEVAWVKAVPDEKNVTVGDMAYLPKGQILVTGKFSGELIVGSDTLKAQSANDAFLLKFQELPYTISIDTLEAFSGDTLSVPVRVSFFPRYAINETVLKLVVPQQQGTFLGIQTDGSLLAEKNWQFETEVNGDTIEARFSGVEEIASGGLFFSLKIATSPEFVGLLDVKLDAALINGDVQEIKKKSGGIIVKSRQGTGDTDLNRVVDSNDALLVLDYLVGKAEVDSLGIFYADASLNNEVSALDAAFIFQFAKGFLQFLPIDTTAFNLNTAGKFNLPDQHILDGQPVGIPLRIENAVDIYAYEMALSYNPDHLKLENLQISLPTLGLVSAMSGSLGEIRIAAAHTAPIQGDKILAALKFTIADSLPNNETFVRLDSFRLNEEEFIPDPMALSTIATFRRGSGDADLNRAVDSSDAALVLDYLNRNAEVDSLGLVTADVTLNDELTALDAAFILQFTKGIIDSLPADTAATKLDTAGKFNLPDQQIPNGQPVEIPIRIENAVDIYAYEMALSYNPIHLRPENLVLTPDSLRMIRASNFSLGRIKIAAAHTQPIQETEIMAALRFSIIGVLPNNETFVRLDSFRLNEEEFIHDSTTTRISLITSIDDEHSFLPKDFDLLQNYPNPFNPTTTIEYAIPRAAQVSLGVYNISGQLVQTLVNEFRSPGIYKVEWNAEQLGAGIYFYKFSTGEFSAVRKAVVLK